MPCPGFACHKFMTFPGLEGGVYRPITPHRGLHTLQTTPEIRSTRRAALIGAVERGQRGSKNEDFLGPAGLPFFYDSGRMNHL